VPRPTVAVSRERRLVDRQLFANVSDAVTAMPSAIAFRQESGTPMMRHSLLSLIGCLAALSMAPSLVMGPQALAQTTCGAPKELDDGWRIEKPESVGLDGAQLCNIADGLKASNANIHAVVIVRHGKVGV
jgi:hypothetical protein